MSKRIYETDEFSGREYINFGGVDFPKFLITRASYEKRVARVESIMSSVKSDLAEGVSNEDAGDTHGQYHNEVAWYRELDMRNRTYIADTIGFGLDQAVLIDDYDEVRNRLEGIGIRPRDIVALSSQVLIQFGDDVEDKEKITIVAPLDGDADYGRVSADTPLARSIQGLSKGKSSSFKAGDNKVNVKILEIN